MTLECREFKLSTNTIVLSGHDRETGKRYFLKEISEISQFYDDFYYSELPELKAIFWLE